MNRVATTLVTCAIVIVIGIWAATRSQAATEDQEPAAALTVDAHAVLVEQEGKKMLRVRAVLINEGTEDVTVITRNVPFGLARDARGIVVDFAYNYRQTMGGRLLIPSLYPLAPVTLRPGEATMLSDTISGRTVQTMEGGEVIRVRYQVSEEWGERLGIWHGLVGTEVKTEVAGRS